MTLSLADKARANRRAALASLIARGARSQNVVSIFDGTIQRRVAVPEFHTCRKPKTRALGRGTPLRLTHPVAA